MEGINIVNLKEGQIYHSIEVVKNTKGYNWTVKCAGNEMEEVLKRVENIEEHLNKKFGG